MLRAVGVFTASFFWMGLKKFPSEYEGNLGEFNLKTYLKML